MAAAAAVVAAAVDEFAITFHFMMKNMVHTVRARPQGRYVRDRAPFFQSFGAPTPKGARGAQGRGGPLFSKAPAKLRARSFSLKRSTGKGGMHLHERPVWKGVGMAWVNRMSKGQGREAPLVWNQFSCLAFSLG